MSTPDASERRRGVAGPRQAGGEPGASFWRRRSGSLPRMATDATGRTAAIESDDQLDLLSESAQEPKLAPTEPTVTDQELREQGGELERLQRATADSLGALDQHTQGRLRELIEHAGDELAALIELVLNNRQASA